MPPKDKYTDPKLRDKIKEEIQAGDKGGEPGQWSARKAQLMASEYKKRGGSYNTPKSDKDESAKHLDKWTEEEWQTKDGEGDAKQSDGSMRRYLPKKAWEEMSEKEKKDTDQKKVRASKEGQQFVSNTGRAKRVRGHAQEEGKGGQADEGGDGNGGEEEKPAARSGQKRGRPKKEDDKKQEEEEEQPAKKKGKNATASNKGEKEASKNEEPAKKGKAASNSKDSEKSSGKTVGSRKDKAEPPAKQASSKRLPKKGQEAYWKAMPGWVDGKVVEVLKAGKEVDGKQVKASKDDPKVVLTSNKSGKICVHKIDNVYFD